LTEKQLDVVTGGLQSAFGSAIKALGEGLKAMAQKQ